MNQQPNILPIAFTRAQLDCLHRIDSEDLSELMKALEYMMEYGVLPLRITPSVRVFAYWILEANNLDPQAMLPGAFDNE